MVIEQITVAGGVSFLVAQTLQQSSTTKNHILYGLWYYEASNEEMILSWMCNDQTLSDTGAMLPVAESLQCSQSSLPWMHLSHQCLLYLANCLTTYRQPRSTARPSPQKCDSFLTEPSAPTMMLKDGTFGSTPSFVATT